MYITSVEGIKNNIDLFSRYARDLQDFEKADVVGDMVGMIIAEKAVGANVAALKTAQRMHESIIDILA